MAQQQLVDYIKQQIGLGVTRETITGSLRDAGWTESDIREAMAGLSPQSSPGAASPPAKAQSVAKPTETSPKSDRGIPTVTIDIVEPRKGESVFQPEAEAVPDPGSLIALAASKKKSHKGVVLGIVFGALIILFGGAGAFFYMKGEDAEKRLTALGAEHAAQKGEIEALTKAVAELTDAKAILANENTDLLNQLSVFRTAGMPAGASAGITVRGVVAFEKNQYTLTTNKGIVLFVKNSRDAKLDAILNPLAGNEAEITGTHPLGSRDVTVTAVNGVTIE